MGIGFTFTAKSKSISDELDLVESLAEAADCSFEVLQYPENHSVVRLEFCPGGELFLNFKDENIFSDVQTNVAGPGFHAYVVEFLQVFAAKQKLEFQIEDETEFLVHKDFDRMREEHFNPWLAKIWEMTHERQTEGESCDWMISWPINTYVPLSISDSVITPMGRYRPGEVLSRIEKEGIENVTADYYVWPDQEKNARFYRNSALFLMWADCYFMPSSRSSQDAAINERIIKLLEKAVEKDATLPFPKQAYMELCSLHESEKIETDSLADYTLFETIGYRKDMIKHVIGNLLLPLPGSFLYVEEENNGHYDQIFYDALDENWHTIRLTVFGLKEKINEFNPGFFEDALEPPIRISGERVEIQAVWKGFSNDEDDPYYSVFAEIHSDKQIGLMSLIFENETEKDWAFALLKNLSARSE